MRVLITGGGGFIGSHLVDSQLAQGNHVRTIDLNLDRLLHVASHSKLEMVQGSITDFDLLPELMQGIDVIYHLASAHLDVTLSDADYELVNVQATKQLLQVAFEADAQRFVHCSTNGVVGEINDPPVDETAVCRPTNVYERTKLVGEEVALRFREKTRFPVVIIRPSWVYGPRCPRTAKLIRTVRKRQFIMFGDGKTLRHPVYISDAIKGMELAAKSSLAGGAIYFIAGQQYLTIDELVHMIAEVLNVQPPFLHLPLMLGKMAGYSLETAFKPLGRRPPISQRSLDFYTKDNAYNIDKARRELGFIPGIDLRNGLQKTLAAMP